MTSFLKASQALVIGSALGLSTLSIAPAQAASPTAVLSPREGATVVTGFKTFQVYMNEPAGNYHLLVFGCDSSYYEWVDFYFDGNPAKLNLNFPALTCAAYDYNANLLTGTSTDPGTETEFLTGNGFTVRRPDPRPEIKYFTISEPEIWPAVKDGYKDSTTIEWESKRYDDARVEILSPSRSVVASQRAFIGYWSWNGHVKGKVKTGTYRVRLTVTNEDGLTVSETKKVSVKHKRMPGNMTYDYAGTKTTKRSSAGNCQQRAYDGELTLDCWNGRFAQADYIFKIPRNAHNLEWNVAGKQNCCPRGTLSKTGKRISPTRFRISVRVTNWRSFTIRRVHFYYEAKMMFRQSAMREEMN